MLAVSSLADAIAEDGQIVVHDLDGHDVEIANKQRLVLMNLVKLDGRNARIAVLGKAVRQHLQHRLLCLGISIDVYLSKLTVRPYVVHPSHVVVVSMSDENAVNLPEGLRHNLLTEVWTAVDKQARAFCFDKCRTA